jgi:serine/threonine protein phosphatase 1
MNKTILIGDIHACNDELQDLLQRVGPTRDDQIIALGDVVDRGPDNRGVLEFLRDTPNATTLMGNHERKHVRAARGEVKAAIAQRIARDELGADYPQWLDFLATLPSFIEQPDALLVHGFIEPGVPLERQRETVLAGTLSGEFHLQKTYAQPWYELYDGPKPVIVGHHDYLGTGEPLIHNDRVFGIDTSAVRGGRLTALMLPEFRIVQVPARRDHWARVKGVYTAKQRSVGSLYTKEQSGRTAELVVNGVGDLS